MTQEFFLRAMAKNYAGGHCWDHLDSQTCVMAADEIERLRAALVEICDHWATQYDHPRKAAEMYRGPYGIGITDGHRACAIIAEAALSPADRGPGVGSK